MTDGCARVRLSFADGRIERLLITVSP